MLLLAHLIVFSYKEEQLRIKKEKEKADEEYARRLMSTEDAARKQLQEDEKLAKALAQVNDVVSTSLTSKGVRKLRS